jgi:hypothetical protein
MAKKMPSKVATKPGATKTGATKAGARRRKSPAKPKLLSGGNPQIAKGDGDAPVQAYIDAMPGWKRDLGRRLDALITRTVPGVRKAVKWNSPFYGVEGQGWFLQFHVFAKYVKVAFVRGTSLRPMPPGESKQKEVRYLDIHEDHALDEAQLARWIRQAAALPGWDPGAPAKFPDDAPRDTQKGRPMKSHPKAAGDAASHVIDEKIAALGDWRGEALARMRALIREADPDVLEEVKWMGTPVWSHDGGICTGETYKSVVKLTFFQGASLKDPAKLFNSSLEGNTRRAIDIHEGEKLDAKAFQALVRAAVAFNAAGKKKSGKPK